MIAIDGKPINEYKEDNVVRKTIEKAIAEIRKQKLWTLKFHPRLVKKKSTFSPDSYDETSQGINFKHEQKYFVDGMEHDVRYYQHQRTTEKGIVFTAPPLDFSGTMILDSTREADKIFAFVCLSPFCAAFQPLAKYQNTNKREPYYMVEDLIAEARAINAAEERLNKVRGIIFNNSIHESQLRDIAQTFGVKGAKGDMNIELVKLNLKNIILKTNKGKYNHELIAEFLKSVNASSNIELRAAIKRGIEINLIGTKDTKAKTGWYTLSESKTPVIHICDVPKIGDKEEALYQFLVADAVAAKEFIAFINAGVPSVEK